MRRIIGPHPVDQLIHRHRPVDVDKQRCQDAPLPGMTEIEASAVDVRLDLTEQAELRCHPVQRSPVTAVCPSPPRSPANISSGAVVSIGAVSGARALTAPGAPGAPGARGAAAGARVAAVAAVATPTGRIGRRGATTVAAVAAAPGERGPPLPPSPPVPPWAGPFGEDALPPLPPDPPAPP